MIKAVFAADEVWNRRVATADLPGSYRRYLVNALRQEFDPPGTPVRMMLRKGKNPYDAR